jgi:hypothetical protein
MATDSNRGVVVLFGGYGGDGEYLDDTWEHDGTAWTQVATPASPPARTGHAMAYDSNRGVVVLFGGSDSPETWLPATWEYDGSTWVEIPTALSPTPRSLHAMAYDSARGVVVLVGGHTDEATADPMWEYDGATWTPVDARFPVEGPSVTAPFGHGLAYDAARAVVVLFGGVAATHFGEFMWDATWELDGSTWTRVETPLSPAPRSRHAMAHDAGRGRVVLFGGSASNDPALEDTWEYDGSSWARVETSAAPVARYGHAMAHDPRQGHTLLFGGYFWDAASGDSYLNDTWRYTGP